MTMPMTHIETALPTMGGPSRLNKVRQASAIAPIDSAPCESERPQLF